MSEGFNDPAPPPDPEERLRASDLVGKACLILPTGTGMWPAKEATVATADAPAQKAQGERPYVEATVYTLDRAGVTAHEEGLRVSWWRTIDDLTANIGTYVLATPKKEADNSIVLAKVSDEKVRAAAAVVVEERKSARVAADLGGEVDPEEAAF